MNAGPERLAYIFPAGTQTKQIQAYDASGAYGDNDLLHAFTRYIDSNGENVIFDEYDPGTLYRQQMNIWGVIEGKILYGERW